MPMTKDFNPKSVEKTLTSSNESYTFYSFERLAHLGLGDPHRLPFSLKILFEVTFFCYI